MTFIPTRSEIVAGTAHRAIHAGSMVIQREHGITIFPTDSKDEYLILRGIGCSFYAAQCRDHVYRQYLVYVVLTGCVLCLSITHTFFPTYCIVGVVRFTQCDSWDACSIQIPGAQNEVSSGVASQKQKPGTTSLVLSSSWDANPVAFSNEESQ